MASGDETIKLGYWAIRGLGQVPRLLLAYAEANWEDVHYEQGDAPNYSRTAWTDVKYELGLPFPNLPYLIEGDFKLTQSAAIINYIANKFGIVASNPQAAAISDMVGEETVDCGRRLTGIAYNSEFENLKPAYLERLPKSLQAFEDFLGDNTYFAGDEITVADFRVYDLLTKNLILEPTCLDNFPKLAAFVARFEEIPQIKAYITSDKFVDRPINNKSAAWK